MVNIGLLGCGRWGRLILRDLKALGARVSVVVHGTTSRANAEAGQADAIVEGLDALPAMDGYVVAVPTALHAEFLLRLLETGKPVFCEKPLTRDVEAARRIVAEGGDRVFVMDKWRYHGGVLGLKAIADSGELGPVLGIRTTRVQWGCPHDDVEMDWILLPHDLSIVLEVLGFVPEPRWAAAEMSDGVLAGLSGVLESGGAWMQFEVGIRSPQHRRTIELRCRDGVATLGDAYDDAITVLRTAGCVQGSVPPEAEQRPVSVEMPLLAELAAFLGYVRGESPPPKSSAAEGLLVIERLSGVRELAGLGL